MRKSLRLLWREPRGPEQTMQLSAPQCHLDILCKINYYIRYCVPLIIHPLITEIFSSALNVIIWCWKLKKESHNWIVDRNNLPSCLCCTEEGQWSKWPPHGIRIDSSLLWMQHKIWANDNHINLLHLQWHRRCAFDRWWYFWWWRSR